MPNWIGPAVTLGLAVFGYVAWLVWQNIKGQIRDGVREAVDKRFDEVSVKLEKIHDRIGSLDGGLRELRTQRTGDIEVTHVKVGQVSVSLEKHELRCDQRFTDLERIVGRARSLLDAKDRGGA